MAENFWEKDAVVSKKDEWWSQDKVAQTPAAPAEEAGFSLGDIAKSFGIGATGSTEALTNVFGAENVASRKLGDVTESIQQSMTPGRRAELERQAARMKAAEESGSTLQEIKAGALNVLEAPLQSTAQALGSFVPYLPALFAAPAAAALGLGARAVSAITAVAQQAPKVIGTAQGAGAVKGAIYDGVYQAEIEAGVDPELAKQKAEGAQSYFGGNFDQIALGAGLGLLAGSKGVEEFLTPVGRAGLAPTLGRRVGEAIVKESIPEGAQEGQERLAQNIALQREGYDVDTFAGVAGGATQGAIMGALAAGPIASVAGPQIEPKTPEAVAAFEREREEFARQAGPEQKLPPGTAPADVDAEIDAVEAEVEPPVELPGGFTVTRRELSRQDVPEAFGIFPEGGGKPLATVATQEEAEAKLESLTQIRQEEQERLRKESEKIDNALLAERRKIEVMEATGQTDTDQYVQAKAMYDQKQQEALEKGVEIDQKIESYFTPLTFAPMGTRTNVQSEFIVNRGQEQVGVFPSFEAAETTLREIAPEPFKQAEVEFQTKKIESVLKPAFAKFNLGDVGLNIVEAIKTDTGQSADGSYARNLIQVAMDTDKPLQTMRHESMHALKELEFFTPQQWKALTERAEKQWIKEYLEGQTAEVEIDGKPQQITRLEAYKRMGLTQEAIVEEAIADAFGAYDRGATPPPGLIASLYKKLKNFFVNFGQALRGAGFESADDIFQRVERGELKSRKPKAEKTKEAAEKPEKFSLQQEEQPSEGRAYKLDIDREKRKMAKSAVFTEEEMSAVISDAQKLDLSDEQTNKIIQAVKADKKRFPVSQGWAPLKVVGIEVKTDDDGKTIPDSETPKYAAIAYGYNVPPGAGKAPSKVDQVWLGKVSNKFQSLIEGIYKRASQGDVNAKNIIAHQTWYKNVATTLRREYGGFGDTLADLLGATSPNTPVDTNWRFSIDVMRRFVRGDFDAEMRKFVKYIDGGESPSKYPSSDKIRQLSGKLYGMNSTNAMLALADMWRAIKPNQAPKARNFALNLIGQSNMATIDVWAARMLRRAAGMVPGASFDRIPPPAEQGVSGTWNADATKVTGAFGFGADVLQKVSDNLAKKGIVVDPPDLQAIAWFAEKELWGKKGWTTKAGEGGSFEENIEAQPTERFIAGHSVQIGSAKPDQATVIDAQKDLASFLKKDSSVLAYRVMQTSGLYGNEVEASFDTEIVADKGKFDPEGLIKKLSSISKKNRQMDIFVSRVIGPGEKSENARPGVEIYFKTPQDMAKIMPVLEKFTARGQDGFTLAVDPRAEDGTNQFIGVRLQYVPEISMRFDEGLRQKLLIPGQLERTMRGKATLLESIVADISKMDGVAHASVANYDTLVIGKENYNDYIAGRVTEEDQTIGGQPWLGQPIRTHVERAIARLEGSREQDDARDVSGVGTKPRTGKKFSLSRGERILDDIEQGPGDRGGIVLGKKQAGAISYVGAHYGKAQVDQLDATKYGTGLRGAERRRLDDAFDERIKKRVYFYIKKDDGSTPIPESGVGQYVYTQKFDNILPPGPEMSRLFREANGDANNFETNVIDAGYDGYAVPSMGMMVVLNHNTPVQYRGTRAELSERDEKFSLKNVRFPSVKAVKEAVAQTEVPDTPEFKRFIAGNQWTEADGKPTVFYHATAREFLEFTPAGQSQAIFLAKTPEEAETFGSAAEDKLRREIYRAINKDEKLSFFQGVVDAQVKKGTITAKQGEEFIRQAKRKAPEYGDFGDIEQEVYDALMDLSPTKMSIMPLYARAETPFEFENADHVEQVMDWVTNNTEYPQEFPEKWLAGLKGRIKQGLWQAIEDKRVQMALRRLGFDSFTVRENRNSPKNYAVYQPEQVKSVTGNLGEFDRKEKNIKFSLPTIPQGADDRINETTTGREQKGFARRIVEAIAPKSAAHFRAAALNRYNQLSVYDKKRAEQMGGAALLADQSAESAALMSDVAAGVAASAMGFDNRSGGIPVLRNGITTIDSSVKGLIASLEPLAAYGDPRIYQRYQYWAMVKRGKRLNAQGKETGLTSADIAFAKMLEQKHPEFVTVQKDLIKFNNGLVKYMVDTGVLSKERGAEYVKYADYVPFYRQMEGEDTVGPNLFSSISNVRPPKKLKGKDVAEAPLADFLETMVRNTTSAIQAGAKNYAAQRAIDVVTQVKAPGMGATRLNKKSNEPNVINVLEKGEVVSYETADELLLYAVQSLNLSEIPGLSILAMPADALRNLVTRDPGFMMANLLRDSLSSYVTSGQKMTPIVDTVIGFGKALGNMSPTTRALLDAGVISGYDTGNIEESGRNLEADLAKKAGKRKDSIIFRPFTSLWDGLEKGTTASDAATRAVIYDRVLAETGNEAEALYRALEVMNFHRKGGNTLIRILTATIPFFNARLQGLDLFYRASSGNMNNKDAAAIKRKFFMRGTGMMALSVAYYLAVADDEEYKKQEQETKDNNWIIPALGIRIPIPFEVGVLFKVLPERITALLSGRDTAKDFGDSALRNFTSTFGFNPFPQAIKPLVETYVDYNFFTGRPIISEGLKDVAPEFQVGPGTTSTAEWIAGAFGASPMKVDHIIKGYTGTIGGYALEAIDSVSAQFSDTPKATKRFEQMPVIKRFVSDPEARGSVTEFYKLKDSVDTVVRTLNLLEKTGESDAYIKYLQENKGTFAFKEYVRDTERTMKELRAARVAIRSSSMSGDEKRDALLQISRAESQISSEIQRVKKAIASIQ
jgi:hypothetical protein